jgi:hypothetical protein
VLKRCGGPRWRSPRTCPAPETRPGRWGRRRSVQCPRGADAQRGLQPVRAALSSQHSLAAHQAVSVADDDESIVTDGRAQLQVYPSKPALGTLDRMDVCAPLPLLSCAPGSRDLRPDANRGAFAGPRRPTMPMRRSSYLLRRVMRARSKRLDRASASSCRPPLPGDGGEELLTHVASPGESTRWLRRRSRSTQRGSLSITFWRVRLAVVRLLGR